MNNVEPLENPALTKDIPQVEEESASNSIWSARSVLIFVVAGIMLYAAGTLASDYRSIVHALVSFPVKDLALIMTLVVIGWLLRAWRFHFYLASTAINVPLSYSIQAFLAGFALSGTPGKVGEAVKGVFLKQDYGVPVTKVVGIVMMERLMDLLGVLLLGSCSLLLFEGWRSWFLICAGLVVGGGLFLCMESIYRPVLERTARISYLAWFSNKVLSILLTGRELINLKVFLIGLLISTIAWGLESFSMYLVMGGFGLPATVLEANFVFCFSIIVGALSMLPGGIGGTEAGMVGLLKFMGIAYKDAMPAVILIRLCTLWAAILVGVVFMLMMISGRKGRQPEERF